MIIIKKPIKKFPLFFTALSVLVLLTLGCWQLKRLQEKNLLISTITESFSKEATNTQNLRHVTKYSNTKLYGKFLNNNIHLYRRIASEMGKDGYYLLTPFQTKDNQIILVARGWFKAKHKKDMELLLSNTEISYDLEEITGVILPSERTQLFLPKNDIKNNIWFVVDIAKISDMLDLNLEDGYFLQLNTTDFLQFMKPLTKNGLVNIKNDHLEYALTWFSLAACIIIIYIIYHKKSRL